VLIAFASFKLGQKLLNNHILRVEIELLKFFQKVLGRMIVFFSIYKYYSFCLN
jgi:hypothetical protein